MNQLLSEGKAPLSEKQLRELIVDHSLHLEAIDFNAKVQFLPNGQLVAVSLKGVHEKGKWSITSDNQLCMKFDRWYFGDAKCYKLFNEKDQYVFFTANGARYYTGKTLTTNGDNSADQTDSKSGSSTVSEQITAPADLGHNDTPPARLSDDERAHALTSLARNCPACNLTGADLHGAQLITANLAGANLSGADLRDANLRRANLAGANLAGAKLVRTNLAGANLTDCDLSNADLTDSNLILANVTGAKLSGSILSGAHLESIQGFKK